MLESSDSRALKVYILYPTLPYQNILVPLLYFNRLEIITSWETMQQCSSLYCTELALDQAMF